MNWIFEVYANVYQTATGMAAAAAAMLHLRKKATGAAKMASPRAADRHRQGRATNDE